MTISIIITTTTSIIIFFIFITIMTNQREPCRSHTPCPQAQGLNPRTHHIGDPIGGGGEGHGLAAVALWEDLRRDLGGRGRE
jgi:hypothetical protein